MKKNVVPLVIIALVVAVAATGIFYGLIVSRMDAKAKTGSQLRLVASAKLEKDHVLAADDFRLAESTESEAGPQKAEDLVGRKLLEPVREGQALTERVLSRLVRQSLPGGIPSGMRAVSVHVADSSSVLELLEAGDHIDIQSVSSRQQFGNPTEYSVQTILQNVIVYGIGKRENENAAGSRGVLTLLVSPADAEKIAQADAASRLRIALRNRKDEGNVAPVLQPVVRSSFRPKSPLAGAGEAGQSFEVQLIEVNADLLPSAAALRIEGGEWQEKLSTWQKSQRARVLAVARLEARQGGEVSWQGGDPKASIRVRLEAGARDLRIEPEAKLGDGMGRKGEERLSFGAKQSALVSGLLTREQWKQWREQFAPGAGGKGEAGEMVLLIAPSAGQ